MKFDILKQVLLLGAQIYHQICIAIKTNDKIDLCKNILSRRHLDRKLYIFGHALGVSPTTPVLADNQDGGGGLCTQ